MAFIEIAQAGLNTVNVGASSPIFGNQMEFGDFVLLVISVFVLISGILSIVFVLYGGLLLILSGGKEDKIKPAVNTIRYAVFGLIITVASIFLFPILGRLLGIDVEKYAKPTRILEKIEEIGNNIFSGENDINYNINSNNINSNGNLPADFGDL